MTRSWQGMFIIVIYYLFVDDCKYGDRKPEECYTIDPYSCYDLDIEKKCCESCGYFRLNDKQHGNHTVFLH